MRIIHLCLTLLLLTGCARPALPPAPVIIPEPTDIVVVTQLDTPTVLVILSERLGIPLEGRMSIAARNLLVVPHSPHSARRSTC